MQRNRRKGDTYRNKDEIETHENQISLPCQVLDQSRGDHGDEEIPEPIGGNADGRSVILLAFSIAWMIPPLFGSVS